MTAHIPYRDTWTGVCCEATVRRYQFGTGDHDASEAEYRDEPCGRLAKTVVRVGSRDVPACYVHERKLRRGLL